MPRYYFHSRDGGLERDETGLDLPDATQARTEAVRYAGALMKDDPRLVWDGRDFRVQVTQEDDTPVMTLIVLAVDHERPIND